ncbi:MAG: Lar family restriction alleviation protein [Ruminococcus sp.]|nr:Lar family restriction alleviation protein [Ruminococcus sp.]
MTEIKLKSCPFCGGKAEIKEYSETTPFSEELTYVYVRCSKCGCEPFMSKRVVNVHYQKNHEEILNNLKHELAEKWNMRANIRPKKQTRNSD